MQKSFKVKGVVDVEASRKARSWVFTNRKITNTATLMYDEIWHELLLAARYVKYVNGDGEKAKQMYSVYANSMAIVIEPLLLENTDDLSKHDFGAPLSTAGVGCVEAAWRDQSPYA